jgi:hypothetical protein
MLTGPEQRLNNLKGKHSAHKLMPAERIAEGTGHTLPKCLKRHKYKEITM